MIGVIAAISQNFVIGKDGEIPWYYKGELKFFREMTTGSVVIMGRKTWESLPKKPLKNRDNIVLSRQEGYEAEGAVAVCSSLDDAIFLAEATLDPEKDIWIIGGESVYDEALDFADKVVLTRVPEVVEKDANTAMFPERAMTLPRSTQSIRNHPYAKGCVVIELDLMEDVDVEVIETEADE